MNTYEIWVEGYAATGERGAAQLITRNAKGENFADACRRWYDSVPDKANWGSFDPEELSVWRCRLFPTEEEARKAFG